MYDSETGQYQWSNPVTQKLGWELPARVQSTQPALHAATQSDIVQASMSVDQATTQHGQAKSEQEVKAIQAQLFAKHLQAMRIRSQQ